jgi:hypothetical protein
MASRSIQTVEKDPASRIPRGAHHLRLVIRVLRAAPVRGTILQPAGDAADAAMVTAVQQGSLGLHVLLAGAVQPAPAPTLVASDPARVRPARLATRLHHRIESVAIGLDLLTLGEEARHGGGG